MHSYHEGKQFEEIFRLAALRQGFLPIQMPLGAKRAGKRLIQIKTPFDFQLLHKLSELYSVTVFIDCKSYNKNMISYSDLTDHQICSLATIERYGFTAGYLIWFRRENAVCFCRASMLRKLEPGKSIHGRDMIYLGTISEFYLGRLFTLHMEKPYG